MSTALLYTVGGRGAVPGAGEDKLKHSPNRPSSDPPSRLGAQSLAILAVAAEARFDDPRIELERTVLLSAVLDAGREMERTMHTWLSQTLCEYRGSPSACDLRATSERLRLTLARFEAIVESTAAQLCRLVPETNGRPAPTRPIDERVPARRLLEGRIASVRSCELDG